MRIVLSVDGQDYLLPEGVVIDEVIKIAEGATPVKKGYGDKAWRETYTDKSMEIKLISNNTVPAPNKGEEAL